MMKRNYSPSFAVGTVAAGGTLGIMIPPSITFCLYGIITETSIVRLFMAGILPGLLLSSMIILFIVISTRLKPSIINWAPKKGDDTYDHLIGSMNFSTAKEIVGEAVKLAEGETGVKTRGTPEKKVGFMTIIPALALIVIVLGSMYAGFATPLEAAGYGVVGALVILIVQRRLTLKILKSAMKNTARTGTMMVFLITCGMTMTFVISYLGISQSIATAIANSGMGRIHVMLLTYLLWFILGCLMDPASMLILTIPFLFQTLLDFGFDPVWIGVVSVLASQIAMITPPVGMNLFVLKTNSGLPMSDIIKGSIPFVLLLFVGLVVLTVFPQIALFLPSKIM
jgi:TRAP-type C4-dicarboxylate transport system permease large subunit